MATAPAAAFDGPLNAAPGDSTVAGGDPGAQLGEIVLLRDVNGDDVDDLITTQRPSSIHIWLGSTTPLTDDTLLIDRALEGGGAPGRAPDTTITGYRPTLLEVADFNGDGTGELITNGDFGLSVFSYPGVGSFGIQPDYGTTISFGGETALAVADFDGIPSTDELAVGMAGFERVEIFSNASFFSTIGPISVLTGPGNSRFGADLAAGEVVGIVNEPQDLLVGAPDWDNGSFIEAGAIFGFDQAGGRFDSFADAEFTMINDTAEQDHLGEIIELIDFTGDRSLDLVALIPGGFGSPRLNVATGPLPSGFFTDLDFDEVDLSGEFAPGEAQVLAGGDVDAEIDLTDLAFGQEVAIGAPSIDQVYVIGHDVTNDWRFTGDPGTGFGSAIAIADLEFMAVGAPTADPDVLGGPETDAGTIEIYDTVNNVAPPFSGTLVVNSVADDPDPVPGDGLCGPTAAGSCSLRAAIEEMNAQAGGTIEFDIPRGGPHVIGVATPLPAITSPVVIDATTQFDNPGAPFDAAGVTVGLRWLAISSDTPDGLDIIADDVTVRGLAISGFPQSAIRVQGSNALIERNRLGVRTADIDPTEPNQIGVTVADTSTGTQILDNLISNNTNGGIDFLGVEGLIRGNRIGTDRTGELARPNGLGINLADQSVTPNRTSIIANVISGNGGNGVQVKLGNFEVNLNNIGVAASGDPLPNGGDGVVVAPTSPDAALGSIGDAMGSNVIATNDGNGITVVGDATVSIVGNSIRDNGGLGIDRDNDGPNGPFPTITSVTSGATSITVTVSSTPSTTVDLYASAECDPSGFGEGDVYLGSRNATFFATTVSFDIPLATVAGRPVFTATNRSTFTGGGSPAASSEFSECGQLPSDATVVSIDLSVDQPTTGPGVTEVPLGDIPIEALLASGEETATEAAPLGAVPLGAVPLGAVPLGAVDLAESPLGAVPLGAVPLGAVPLGAVPLGAVPLSAVPLSAVDFPGGWSALLVGTDFEGQLPQAVTLEELLDSLPANHPIQGVPLSAVDLSASPLGAVSIAGLALGVAPLSAVANEVCLDAATQGINCSDVGDTLIGLELAGYDVAAAPLGAVPLSAVPLGAVPLGAVPLGAVPLSAVPLGAVPLGAVPLSAVPLGAVPLGAVSLGSTPLSAVEIDGAPLGAIPLSAVPLGAVPLGAVPLGAVDLQGTPLGAVPLGAVGDVAGGFGCDLFAAPTCADLGLDDDTTLFEAAVLLEADGGDLASTPLGAVPLSAVPLSAVEVETGEGLVDLADYFGTGTLADLPDEVLDQLTLADILLALVVASDYAWEELDLGAIGIQDHVAGATVVTYAAALTTTGTGLVSTTVELPAGYRYRSGTATFAGAPALDPVIEESGGAQALSWFLDTTAGTETLSFDVSPSLDLGTTTAVATATGGTGAETSGPSATHTVEAVPARATAPADLLILGYLSDPDEIDRFTIDSPGEGFTTSVFLSHQSQDSDLVLYKPETALPAGGDGSTADGPTTRVVEDDGFAQLVGQDLEPEDLGDVPIDPDQALAESSAGRGIGDEVVSDTDLDGVATTYGIQVSGYNGATSDEPYVLRVRFREDVPAPACPPRSFTGGTAAGANALPEGLETLILFDQQRFGAVHGETAAAEALASAQALVEFLNTNNFGAAEILFTDAVTNFAAWDANPCDWAAADAIAKDIRELVVDYATDNESLRYVTIVGGDDVLPFHRQTDATGYANESTFAAEFGPTQAPGVYGAFVASKILTDAPYGDPDPIPWLDRLLYLPEISVGRLVEDAGDIQSAIDTFITFEGELDPGVSALVTGYDFLADGTAATTDALERNGFATTEINSETWSDDDLENAFLTDGGPRLVSANAHYDYARALPAAEQLSSEASYGESTLFQVSDVENYLSGATADLSGNVLFTMGCHAALSVSDIAIGSSPSLPADWAQTFNGAGGSLIGNTGYGYGETVTIGLTEELIVGMAQALDGDLTLGQAVVESLQNYYARAGLYGVYDEKVIQQFTTYGLPMYKVPGLGGDDDPETDLVIGEDPFTGQPSGSGIAAISVTPETSVHGSYWSVDGQTLEIHYRPIQPMTTIDVTVDGLVARGAIITDWTSTDVTVADMAYARPIIDDSSREGEIEDPTIVFPSTFAAVASYERPNPDPGGRTIEAQNLNLIVGQYDAETGTQRLFDDIDYEVFYVDPTDPLADDQDAAVIRQVQAAIVDGTVGFIVDLEDNLDAARVVVLYRSDISTDWQSVDLVNGSPWSGGGSVPAGTTEVEYLVQAVEPSGLVSVSSSKGTLHRAEQAPEPPAPGEGGVTVDLTGPQTDAWYTGPVDLAVDGATAVTIDGTPVPVTGTTIVDDGVHIVSVTAADGTVSTFVVPIDRTGPVVASGTPISIPFGALAEVDYDCRDAGSGTVTCSSSVADGAPIDTSTAGSGSFTVTATDVAGNTTTRTFTYVVEPAPTLTLTVDPTVLAVDGDVTASVVVSGGSADRVEIDWGDGTVVDATSGSHTYGFAGIYDVTATIFLGSGVTVTETVSVVVFDPDGSSVSGNARIDHPSHGRIDVQFNPNYVGNDQRLNGHIQVKTPGKDGIDVRTDDLTFMVVDGASGIVEGTGVLDGVEVSIRVEAVSASFDRNDAIDEDELTVTITETVSGTVVLQAGPTVDSSNIRIK